MRKFPYQLVHLAGCLRLLCFSVHAPPLTRQKRAIYPIRFSLDRAGLPQYPLLRACDKNRPLLTPPDGYNRCMIELRDLLHQRTTREMTLLARSHHLRHNTRLPRESIETSLHTEMISGQVFKRAYAKLPTRAQDALRMLQTRAGTISLQEFCKHFGIIRAYRPWVNKTDPCLMPISIAEQLWVKGFVQPVNQQVHLCAEVAAVLPHKEQRSQPAEAGLRTGSNGALAPGAALLHDLVIWLGMLMGSSPQVWHGRWLPLAWLRAVDERMLARDSGLVKAHSELQMDRLPFLHYLAEVSGSVTTVHGRLMVTQAAWSWLNEAPAAQLAALRRAVGADLSAREPLWERYRLPAEGTYARRQLLLQLKGVTPAVTPAILHVGDGELCLILQPLPPSGSYAQLSAWSRADAQRLIIDANCVRASRLSLPQIADQIARLTGEPLPRFAFDQLSAWLNAAHELRIEQTSLLTTSQSALLDQITGDRRLRHLLGMRLTPHHLVIRPEAATTLSRRLVKRGMTISNLPIDHVNPAMARRDEDCLVHSSESGATADLYLALRLTQEIARTAALSVHIPGALSDTYRTSLSDEDILALETRVRTLVEATRAALSERPQVDVPLAPSQDEPATIRAAVERAFAQRQPLHVEYYSPWQGTITQRHITPLVEIRWEGEVGYIQAWCGLDHAERTFRLDRILRLL